MIWRKDPQYWADFEEGLQEIKKVSEEYVQNKSRPDEMMTNWITPEETIRINGLDKILIRPSRTDEARWAKFIDISHPKHIQSHENFVK